MTEPTVTTLSAAAMPADRHVLKYVQLRYDDNDSLVCTDDAISDEEQALLAYTPTPAPRSKVLLHSCCAPCSGAMVEEMRYLMDLDITIFFYNPNIHPKREYEIRKDENIKYAIKHGIPFVDCDYDSDAWFKRMVGFELEPERGVRCSACFDMRMEVTAAYAVEHGFDYFTTTNATSRWKDELQVNLAGVRAALLYQKQRGATLQFWVYNWRTDAMTRRKYEVSVDEKFYKQEYCGCSYSLRDSNVWRAQQGIPKVKIGGETAGLGTRYFEDVEADEAEESQEVVDAFFRDANAHFGDEKRPKKYQEALQKSSAVFVGRQKSVENIDANNW
ncbi:hypothetical protein SPRG_02226 [Saprolegnia parasitica CBS 223.65]|uniref:Epoxyqueuosine reductase n=1 Tax=Saprolegnia parasitica (strain CBS 223.65) TaxID=695850 RepID=A0A067CRS4_SAPPC|nr:hypothetical protein SPRG_02226 [Saprolegnia parasitica CBS 223.65]KDO33419.1 hypothetical protein SPRG_02226 [Saprolegnia parasitica CBS 223.65]|eukprot:XP_012196165.1 hypothetical protein SPRG_02226 [Saprolegnia parasitica CBS 223.65]